MTLIFLNFFKPKIGIFTICRVLAHFLQMLGNAVESIIKLLNLCGNVVEGSLVFMNFLSVSSSKGSNFSRSLSMFTPSA